MARRLFIAFVLIALVTVLCWFVLPRTGLGLPWYVPMLGYAVILGGAMLPVIEEWSQAPAAPKKRSIDEVDPGPDKEDLERFGEPRLKFTDGEGKGR